MVKFHCSLNIFPTKKKFSVKLFKGSMVNHFNIFYLKGVIHPRLMLKAYWKVNCDTSKAKLKFHFSRVFKSCLNIIGRARTRKCGQSTARSLRLELSAYIFSNSVDDYFIIWPPLFLFLPLFFQFAFCVGVRPLYI